MQPSRLTACVQGALEARGVRTYVCSVGLDNGQDWGTVIAQNLGHCKLMVVLAKRTYGAQGTEVRGEGGRPGGADSSRGTGGCTSLKPTRSDWLPGKP